MRGWAAAHPFFVWVYTPPAGTLNYYIDLQPARSVYKYRRCIHRPQVCQTHMVASV